MKKKFISLIGIIVISNHNVSAMQWGKTEIIVFASNKTTQNKKQESSTKNRELESKVDNCWTKNSTANKPTNRKIITTIAYNGTKY